MGGREWGRGKENNHLRVTTVVEVSPQGSCFTSLPSCGGGWSGLSASSPIRCPRSGRLRSEGTVDGLGTGAAEKTLFVSEVLLCLYPRLYKDTL